MRLSRLVTGLALVGMLMLPMQAQSQTTLTPDTWFSFSWSGLGPVSTQFTATTTTLRVTDSYVVGDMFEIFDDGVSLGTTSVVSSAGGTDEPFGFDADGAFASGLYSTGVFTVEAGSLIEISVFQSTDCCTGGSAFVQSVVTPEPGTVAIFAIGLFGLAFVAMRRQELLKV